MKKITSIALLFLVLSQNAFAQQSSYDTQLLKLAKAIKGEPATREERSSLQKAIANGKADLFLQETAKKYLQDPKAHLKLKQKVDELVRLNAQTSLINNGYTLGSIDDAYGALVFDVISKNKSWDDLFKGKEYIAHPVTRGNEHEGLFYDRLNPQYSEDSSFSEVLDPASPANTSNRKYSFPADDQRIAGIFTTPRFFSRYVNTALNKNRRRAAAVFRIALCDTMIATVPAQDSSSQMRDYDTIFPHRGVTEDQVRKSLAGNIHGQQADCRSCHYKLDPLGQVFGYSAATLGVEPSAGALRFRGQDNRAVDIPLKGFGDLANALTEQPEYVKCQISHFWRWYVGKDVPFTKEIESDLIKKFEFSQRRPLDFIAYLVTLPVFKEKPQILTEDQLLSRQVVKIFKNCTSCHDSQYANVWDLTSLPYGDNIEVRTRRIDLLKSVLDIKNNGARAEMPPKDSLWRPSQDEFASIVKWLDRGAPDFQGKAQLEQGEGK